MATLIVVLLPIVAGCGSSHEAQAQRAIERLAGRVDADSLAAAGLLEVHNRPEQALRLTEQASRLVPERADLVWLQIQVCQRVASCDPEPLEDRLRVLDGKNGSSWLGPLARASKHGDAGAKAAALAALARSERLDIYWTALTARLSRQVASTRAMSLGDAQAMVAGVLVAVTVPAYQFVVRACEGDGLMHDEVLETCRGIAASLLGGDAIITEMVGVPIAMRAWPESSPRWEEANTARRAWDHRSQFARETTAWIEDHPIEYQALCEQHRREQDVQEAVLIAARQNPDPA